MALDKAIELSLRTWYPKDHPLHLDPLPAALGLAEEAGELIGAYKKEKYKNGVSWWDCVKCGHSKDSHNNGECTLSIYPIGLCPCGGYTPKILDELGDLWFYLRILVYQHNKTLDYDYSEQKEIPNILSRLNYACATFLDDILNGRMIDTSRLQLAYGYLLELLRQLDFTLDQVTESNWQKLKDGDNHGWKTARDTVP